MSLFSRLFRHETRATIESPTVPVSSDSFFAFFGIDTGRLPAITIDKALTVPAVAGAVNFLSATMANLPLHAYRDRGADGPERVGGSLQRILNEAPNPEWSSFGWRKYHWQQVFTGGRGLSYIERNGAVPAAIWPFDPTRATVKIAAGRKTYKYEGREYAASEIIDTPFLLKSDQVSARGPIVMGAKAIQLALAMNDYAAGFFAGGGVPPLALVGPMPSGAEAMARARSDIQRAIDGAKSRGEPIFPIPAGYELKPVGFDPDKGQMTEAKLAQVGEIARIYGLPPVFLQDLSRATFSNSEQQDLHLVKHLVSQWAKCFEDELNLKLFGPSNNRRYVEHSVDGLMRGDFKSRMEGMAQAINAALRTPNEQRALDNLPPLPGGDQLFVQGATVPISGGVNDPGSQDAIAAA